MSDYQCSTVIPVPVDDLFDYLSKVENMPRYVARMTGAHHRSGDEVHGEATVERRDVQGARHDAASAGEATRSAEGWYRIDADARRLLWGADGPYDYHGELTVSQGEDGASVLIRLHTLHDDAEGIERGLAETVYTIRALAGQARDAAR
ncbi:MAG TPA: hypothetical protein VI248_15915 [Kineosporiaceae bacterium]